MLQTDARPEAGICFTGLGAAVLQGNFPLGATEKIHAALEARHQVHHIVVNRGVTEATGNVPIENRQVEWTVVGGGCRKRNGVSIRIKTQIGQQEALTDSRIVGVRRGHRRQERDATYVRRRRVTAK